MGDKQNEVFKLKIKKYLFLTIGIILMCISLGNPIGFITFVIGVYFIYLYRKYHTALIELQEYSSTKQKVVFSSSNKKSLNSPNISIYLKQMQESLEIIKTSKNPDTVISRLNFIQELYSKLEEFSDDIPTWASMKSTYTKFVSKRDTYINDSIRRNLDAELIKINALKTEKGKVNRLKRFFENIREISDLSVENLAYIDKLEKETNI